MDNKTQLARNLRKNQTDTEDKLWKKLRNRQILGFKFRRQYVIEGYIADFACVEAKLIIELNDGQAPRQAYDKQRTHALEQYGFTVLRFWNDSVLLQIDDMLGVICRFLNEVNPHLAKREGIKVVLGLGCDRDTPAKTIETAIMHALQNVGLNTGNVLAAASIDKKADEIGLLFVCKHFGWDCTWYAAEQLKEVDVPNPSEVVMKYVGTPSVGEAAAILRAGGRKDDLMVEKYKYRGEDGKNATVSICKVNDI